MESVAPQVHFWHLKQPRWRKQTPSYLLRSRTAAWLVTVIWGTRCCRRRFVSSVPNAKPLPTGKSHFSFFSLLPSDKQEHFGRTFENHTLCWGIFCFCFFLLFLELYEQKKSCLTVHGGERQEDLRDWTCCRQSKMLRKKHSSATLPFEKKKKKSRHKVHCGKTIDLKTLFCEM